MVNTVRTIRHGTLKFKDGGTSVLTLSKLEGGISGDMYKRSIAPILDRGSISEAIYLDDEMLTVSLTFQFREFYGESAGTGTATSSLKEWEFALNDKNNAGITLTKVDATQDVFNINIELTTSNPVGSGSEVITWQKAVVVEAKFDEGYPNKLSMTFMAQAKSISSTITS